MKKFISMSLRVIGLITVIFCGIFAGCIAFDAICEERKEKKRSKEDDLDAIYCPYNVGDYE